MSAIAPAVGEKAQVERHYEAQQQLQSPASMARTSGSNTVPMFEGEMEEGVLGHDGTHSPVASGHQHHSGHTATPPPYSGPSYSQPEPEPEPQSKGPQRYPGLPALDYRLYSPPLFELSADATTIRTTAPYLSSNVTALVDLVRAQSTVPPKLQVHISGRGNTGVDFAIKLNLMSLLVPDDPKQRMDYIRCVSEGELALRGGTKPSAEPEVGDGGLEAWARQFVEDTSSVKSFALERVVANLNVSWLEGQIRSMVATTGYQGVVSVTFPVTHARVVVQSPDRVNKFFTGVTTLFAGKRKYEVVKAVWPFATNKAGEPGRRCVVQTEETWWREWRDPIRYAIATKRKGWVTNEDKLEAIMEGQGKRQTVIDWIGTS